MPPIVRAAAVQAEPRWLDLESGVDQVVELIGQAASNGAQLVTFPETFLPGYPWWIWLDSPAWGMQFVARYSANSMTRDGAEMDRIAAAAARHHVMVVFGFSERAGGSLYMSQGFVDENGHVISVRRKLKPTHVERSVFGEGDGSDLQVHDTSLGRVGALNCWEHFQPLTKYTMFGLGRADPRRRMAQLLGVPRCRAGAGAGGQHRGQPRVRRRGPDLRRGALRGRRGCRPGPVLRHRAEAAAVAARRRVRPHLRARGLPTRRTAARDRRGHSVRRSRLLPHRDRQVRRGPRRALLPTGRVPAARQPRRQPHPGHGISAVRPAGTSPPGRIDDDSDLVVANG